MREIGSEFWDIPASETENGFFSANTSWFMSGRGALKCILESELKKGTLKKACLPSWCCDSMITPFLEKGIEVSFYPVIIENGKLTRKPEASENCDILFLMDWFGYTEDETKFDFCKTVIRDVTHSIFSKTYNDADYYFGSLRKWAGFYTGGFAEGVESMALTEESSYISLRKKAMEDKEKYIMGKTSDKGYLDLFSEAEELLESSAVSGSNLRDINMALHMDIEGMKQKRRRNAEILLGELADMAIFPTLKDNECPLFVPIMVPGEKRDELRRYLIGKSIYLPVHWPKTNYHKLNSDTEYIYDNELSIVCDQRYDENDMERIIKAIREF